MLFFDSPGARFGYMETAPPEGGAGPELVWAPGWGHTAASFAPLAECLAAQTRQILLDYPGMAGLPPPPLHWGTADYADAVVAWLKARPRPAGQKRIWIGHSFGCRVGLQVAARHPGVLDGLFLIAAAGIKRHRPPLQRLKIAARVAHFKVLKRLARLAPSLAEPWKSRLGSADYRAAGPLRPILVRVIQEDLTASLPAITIPVHLVYGAADDDTPPEMGERFARLLPDAQLTILEGFNHHTILTTGRHQLLFQLDHFLKEHVR